MASYEFANNLAAKSGKTQLGVEWPSQSPDNKLYRLITAHGLFLQDEVLSDVIGTVSASWSGAVISETSGASRVSISTQRHLSLPFIDEERQLSLEDDMPTLQDPAGCQQWDVDAILVRAQQILNVPLFMRNQPKAPATFWRSFLIHFHSRQVCSKSRVPCKIASFHSTRFG
jgi:hypothetical protein